MQLRDIEYVIALAEYKSFSKASESLCITQPALSLGIKRLEKEYGFKLFIRKRKESILTREGELVFRDAKLIAQMHKHLDSQMRDIKSHNIGKLNIGITSLFARFYFANIYKLFKTLYPAIEVVVKENNSVAIEHSLTAGMFDIALMPLPFSSNTFEYEELVNEETFLALPPRFPSTSTMKEISGEYGYVNLADFIDAKFIFQVQGQRLREIADQACSKIGFIPNIVFETQSIDAANALVAADIGVSFVPSTIFKTKKNNYGVRYYHINDINISRRIVAAFNSSQNLSPAAKTFINVAKSVITNEDKFL